jgi:hypothetical protein
MQRRIGRVGAQNEVRYANFPATDASLNIDGKVTVYDTQDHRINGFSQQQPGSGSLSFGVDVSRLPPVSTANGTKPPPEQMHKAPAEQQATTRSAPPGHEDILTAVGWPSYMLGAC